MTEHREGRVSTRCTVRPCNCTLHNSTLCDVCVFGPARNYEMTYSTTIRAFTLGSRVAENAHSNFKNTQQRR